jgi:hypothetical protein
VYFMRKVVVGGERRDGLFGVVSDGDLGFKHELDIGLEPDRVGVGKMAVNSIFVAR